MALLQGKGWFQSKIEPFLNRLKTKVDMINLVDNGDNTLTFTDSYNQNTVIKKGLTLEHGTAGSTSGLTVIPNPSSGFWSTGNASNVGYLMIKLPVAGNNTMLSFEVTVFQYVSGRASKFLLGFYNYSGGTINPPTIARLTGRGITTVSGYDQIRIGRVLKAGATAGSNLASDYDLYVAISNLTEDYDFRYPKIMISNLLLGHANHRMSYWDTGWELSYSATLPVNWEQVGIIQV